MTREWKPGDVAIGRVGCHAARPERLVKCEDGDWVRLGAHSRAEDCLVEDLRPLVVIDPEDRDQVERLLNRQQDIEAETHPELRPIDCRSGSCWIDTMQAALCEFENGRKWTDGDVVQRGSEYTAQRKNGLWYTTSMGDGAAWGTDEYVTNHVARGNLRVLREQAVEVQP